MYLLYRYASLAYRYTSSVHTCTPVYLYGCIPVHLYTCMHVLYFRCMQQLYRYTGVRAWCTGIQVLYIPVHLYTCMAVYLYTCTPACVCCTFAVCSNCRGIQVYMYLLYRYASLVYWYTDFVHTCTP